MRLLNLQGVAGDQHISLLNIVQLLIELKLVCIGHEKRLKIGPGFFQCFFLSNVSKHVIMNTCAR